MLGADPLEVVGGELEHKPQLPILLALTEDVAESPGIAVLRRWLRATGPKGRPLELLTAHDFAAFEDALEELRRRGFVLSSGGPPPS